MCCRPETDESGEVIYRPTPQEHKRAKRFEELQTLYNLATGAYGNTAAPDGDLGARVLAEMEKLVLGTPFAGGANNGI